jgi:prepilin-type N-terminal cleavage/methylation domain-containing protein
MRNYKGFSLLEILVVVSIFAVLGILITRSVLLTLTGGKKSESLIGVRENLNYSVGIIERQLRNANSIATCPNSDPLVISYTDQNGNATAFSCVDVGTAGYIASGAGATRARLSSDTVNVTDCSFVCATASGTPSSVTINLEAKDASASGTENSTVTTKTQVFLRNY